MTSISHLSFANKESIIIKVRREPILANSRLECGKPCSRNLFKSLKVFAKMENFTKWMIYLSGGFILTSKKNSHLKMIHYIYIKECHFFIVTTIINYEQKRYEPLE